MAEEKGQETEERRQPPEFEIVRNCVLPRNVKYDVEEDVWARRENGTITIGYTDSSQTVSGPILYAHYIKEEGEHLEEGEPIATVEAGKWMGTVRAPFSGELVAINHDAEEKTEDVHIINKSPYHRGWIAKMDPDDGPDEALSDMVGVDKAVEAYREKMEEMDLDDCIHCEAFEV